MADPVRPHDCPEPDAYCRKCAKAISDREWDRDRPANEWEEWK